MLNNRNLLALLTVATAGLAACEPLFVDFDGYRLRPEDAGDSGGTGGAQTGGSSSGASGGDGGSAAGGSGNSAGNGGSAAAGSGNSGGDAGSGNGGTGNASGDGGSAGSGGTSATCSASVTDAACNDCLQANCCSELEGCPPGSACDTFRKCVADNCWDAEFVGQCLVQCDGGHVDPQWSSLFDCICNKGSAQCAAACQRTVGCGASASGSQG